MNEAVVLGEKTVPEAQIPVEMPKWQTQVREIQKPIKGPRRRQVLYGVQLARPRLATLQPSQVELLFVAEHYTGDKTRHQFAGLSPFYMWFHFGEPDQPRAGPGDAFSL